jgi:hypothetical protein
MAAGQDKRTKRRKRRSGRKRGANPMIAHRAFAPLMGLWGALLGALPVLVLPSEMIATSFRGTAVALLNGSAQGVIAAVAGLAVGGIIFAMAGSMSARARRRMHSPSIAELATRRNAKTVVRPIDPERDLGSRRLDDPVETMPFAREDAPPPQSAPASEPVASAPRALDLGEFAELPGRNGVWVEEPAPAPAQAPEPAPVRRAPVTELRVPTPGSAALTRLRAVPTSELSLVQMVERFAGALHEHRSSAPQRPLTTAELAAREAALAEALKALAALSGDTAARSSQAGGQQEQSLRAALTRLQTQRGAA